MSTILRDLQAESLLVVIFYAFIVQCALIGVMWVGLVLWRAARGGKQS